MWEKLKIEKSYIEKNSILFTCGVGWAHMTEPKMQENLKWSNFILAFCC